MNNYINIIIFYRILLIKIMKFLFILWLNLIYYMNVFSLKKALLKIKFNSKNECDSFILENLNIGKTYLHNIQIKSLLHKNVNPYEEKIIDDKIEKKKGYPLLSFVGKSNKRLLNPLLLLNEKRDELKKIFIRNIQYENEEEMKILVILPSFFYIPIKLNINYSIYYPYNIIYSKDYCIDFSVWKINNFISLKFWNNAKKTFLKRTITKKFKKYL